MTHEERLTERWLEDVHFVRELARRLVRDEHLAEDVAQETLVCDLENGSPAIERRRGWLRRVLVNRTLEAARRARHRERREQVVASPEAHEPPVDVLVTRAETARAVIDAVLALNPAQRDVILLRFFDGLRPKQIATRLELPVETVRSRIKRALAALYGTLREHHGNEDDALRRRLGFLVSMPPPTIGFLQGVTMMALWKGFAFGVVVLVVVGFVGKESFDDGERDTIDSTIERFAGDATDHRSEPMTSEALRSVITPGIGEHDVPRRPPVDPHPLTTKIFGRCVDETGSPLEGARVILRARAFDEARIAAHELEHGPLSWTNPDAVITGADGGFLFAIDPPPGHQIVLDVAARDRCGLHVRWVDLERGEAIDLKDLALVTGCILTGDVRNEKGRPVPSAVLHLSRVGSSQPTGSVRPLDSISITVPADGAFRSGPVPAGSWTLSASLPHVVDTPERLRIEPGRRTQHVSVTVVERITREITLGGIVVDVAGNPVHEAMVRGGSSSARTDGKGRFTLTTSNPSDSVFVEASKDGYMTARSAMCHAWGSEDVRLVLQPAPGLVIAVRDGDGAPVERFGIRLYPDGRANHMLGQTILRDIGWHEGGRLHVANLEEASSFLIVVPAGQDVMPSAPRLVRTSPGVSSCLDVVLHPPGMRTVRVESADGVPVPGSRVVIAEHPFGEPIRDGAVVFDLDRGGIVGGSAVRHMIALAEGVTDERGTVVLRGPVDRPVTVAALGPTHRPRLVRDVELTNVDDPIVVRVDLGATLVGRVEPLDVLLQLQSMTWLADANEPDRFARRQHPTIHLERGSGADLERFPRERWQGIMVDDAGCFEVQGVPPGDWNLVFGWTIRQSMRGPGTSSHRTRETLTMLEALREAETRDLSLDIASLRHVEIAGRVFVNGEPFRTKDLQVRGIEVPDTHGERRRVTEYTVTDEDGRFRMLLRAGTYEVDARLYVARLDTCFDLHADRRLELNPHDVRVEATFHVHAIPVRVRIVDLAGRPVANVRLRGRLADDACTVEFPQTNDDGRTQALLTPETWTLSTLPKACLDPSTVHVLRRAHGDAALEAARIDVLTWTPALGSGSEERELQLPASWASWSPR
ncbi:MAG: sigma-70 family RNA polymerase sigma factor [Planctomycetes bacterium]|nr:sigma-70 family RNA polymerase sigma factor [Planctomycetota bacterium]